MVGTLCFVHLMGPDRMASILGGTKMKTPWTRRALMTGAAAAGTTIIVKPVRAADYAFTQYHNQSDTSTLHKNLAAMWEAIRRESNGRVGATVLAPSLLPVILRQSPTPQLLLLHSPDPGPF